MQVAALNAQNEAKNPRHTGTKNTRYRHKELFNS
jgi:hypothetical protein